MPARAAPAKKRTAGATDISRTPLQIRVVGAHVAPAEKQDLRKRLDRQLRRFAKDITRIDVRFEDLNGPRGGIDTVCRIKVSASGLGHMVVESRATNATVAARTAARLAKVALSRALAREGRSMGRGAGKLDGESAAGRRKPPPPRRPAGGSLIGRRVGRSRENLLRAAARPEKVRRDAWTDTSLPSVSATDRKAGGGSTAARNTRLRTNRAAVTLEDSATGKPSRKSTRKSANRTKSGSKQGRRETRKLHAPSSRAQRR